MAQIDGDAVLADGHPLDQKMDDAGLLRRIQSRPKLIELAERGDDSMRSCPNWICIDRVNWFGSSRNSMAREELQLISLGEHSFNPP